MGGGSAAADSPRSQVKEARKAGPSQGHLRVGVELTDMTVADGRQVPFLPSYGRPPRDSHGQDAATIGTAQGSGIDWSRCGLGHWRGHRAGAGAAAGIGAVLLTRGRPTIPSLRRN